MIVAGRVFEHDLEGAIVEDFAHARIDLSDGKLGALAALLAEQGVGAGQTGDDAQSNRFALSKDDVGKSERACRGGTGCRGTHKKLLSTLRHVDVLSTRWKDVKKTDRSG